VAAGGSRTVALENPPDPDAIPPVLASGAHLELYVEPLGVGLQGLNYLLGRGRGGYEKRAASGEARPVYEVLSPEQVEHLQVIRDFHRPAG